MSRLVRRTRSRGALAVLLCALAWTALQFAPPASATPTLTASTVTNAFGATNVTPMWGPQINKVVYDNSWYYAVVMNGSGTSYPWTAEVWKSSNGTTWTKAVTLGQWVYQPPGLLLDSGNRLWLDVPCYTGGSCFPGASTLAGSPQQYIYLQRLQFSSKLADGSFDFSTFSQYSVLTTSAERYYRGEAMDPSRRYVYQAYSTAGWYLNFSTFDTWTGTESTHVIGTPGTSPQEAYLYPRVRPGTAPGEVWLLFSQIYVAQSSTSIFGVQLWHSTDGGATWSGFMVASCPSPDASNWCDASDLVIDQNDVPNVLFYKRVAGVSHLYYWKGTAGSVTLTGSPTDLGAYDNHSQMSFVGSGNRFIFAHNGPTTDNNLQVLSSPTGATWTTTTMPVPGAGLIYSPNIMRPESGTWHSEGTNVFSMLLSSTATGTTSPYSQVQFVTYSA